MSTEVLPQCSMCGRYTIFQITDSDEIKDRFGATPWRDLPPRYNAAPGQNLPVITQNGLGSVGLGFEDGGTRL